MLEYIYFVKCPNCEDEHFSFFNEAKDFALGCLNNKPIIAQVEVDRNDFGECVGSTDLGTVWSWEDMMKEIDAKSTTSAFTPRDFGTYDVENDPEFNTLDNSLEGIPDNFRKPVTEATSKEAEMKELAKEMLELGVECSSYEEFANFMKANDDSPTKELYAVYKSTLESCQNSSARKPIPEGMTIEQLVEEMEENEDTVECTWCNELFGKDECRKEVNLGWLCSRCEAAIKSRGESLTFRENDYWDFLDEDLTKPETVELEYEKLTITLQGPKRDVDDWDEIEHTGNYVYKVDKSDLTYALFEMLTDADVSDVTGGLEALEDEKVYEKFLETHFDALFTKYYDKLLEYFKDDAIEAFASDFTWDDYVSDSRSTLFDESVSSATTSALDTLEDTDAYHKRLTFCPECGDTSFDAETGFCISCGFN